MRLSELKNGEKAIIVKILGYGAFRKRVMEMGFTKGREIEAILSAPLKDPVKYSLMGYEVSLRRSEARMIEVIKIEENSELEKENFHGHSLIREAPSRPPGTFHTESKTINVVLIGNPNCGKTSLFNVASGAKEHTGNYGGVTVDSKTGHFYHNGYRFNIVDLPGTYSLTAYSPEELYVRKYLRENNPDVIVNVVEASNLERSLYLTTELIDMDHSMVIALNMYDELRRRGDRLDYELLGKMIGVPIVPTVSRTGEGVNNLFDTVIKVYEQTSPEVRHIHVNLGLELEKAVREIREVLKKDPYLNQHFSPRYVAIKLLEEDSDIESLIGENARDKIAAVINKYKERLMSSPESDDIPTRIADEKYGFITGALAEVMERSGKKDVNNTKVIDAFVTNRLFGFPIFIIILLLIFWATFVIGAYPQAWIEDFVAWTSQLVNDFMPDGPLKDLIAEGIIGGVGGVIVFLPNIMILYFFISFMEDSGYMARAAFIMDRIMHRIGLHGKSFIPLLMGFGCNVPAIMASRSIESRSSRIVTILINPFMSCSARLPVYVLLIGTFFEPHAALIFLLVYGIGVVVAVFTARMFQRTHFLKEETPFVMELPPYRIPTFKSTMRHMWWKGKQYLQKMGGIILLASIVIWALNYFPLRSQDSSTPEMQSKLEAGLPNNQIDTGHDSYLEMLGKIVNPVMEPLGFTWRSTVAALAGLPAKEVIVSTLGVLYTGDEEVSESRLGSKLMAENPVTGHPDFTSPEALAFIVFVLLYCPCIATLTAIIRETGSLKYGLFSVLYNTSIAWLVGWIVYQIAILF
ncbi:MAG: ferrous iron transport protein B [Muribaculaceae bacterium]|nr:ferrous iron transport protein B [Muribaculaceae bacterium]